MKDIILIRHITKICLRDIISNQSSFLIYAKLANHFAYAYLVLRESFLVQNINDLCYTIMYVNGKDSVDMSIQLVSISHKTASLDIRALFAFDQPEQLRLMNKLKSYPEIDEVVMIATCNRTEIYTYSEHAHGHRDIFDIIQNALLAQVCSHKMDDISRVFRFYSDEKAIAHLFEVACGLDSMVIGEDQILGQVKTAHQQAMDAHMCGTYLNSLFRYAVTAAKKVKTDTMLSKTPVSTATICIKAARDYMEGLTGKNIMIIGASGKIGNIVLKNLLTEKGVRLFVTTRGCAGVREMYMEKTQMAYVQIPYEERYKYLKEMDVVISATASPHYTLTYERVAMHIEKGKKMAFMDLAVPVDIERKVGQLENIVCLNIDDFSRAAGENNHKKEEAAMEAMDILSHYEGEFLKWMLFQQSLGVIETIKGEMLRDYENKGIEYAVDKFFYRMRDCADANTLKNLFNCFK